MALRKIGLVFLLSMVGKLLGFLRLLVIAYALGPTAETDGLVMALTILLSIDVIFLSGSSIVIAQAEFTRRDELGQRVAALAAFSRWAGRWLLLSIVFSLICALFADPIAALVAPGFDERHRDVFGQMLIAGSLVPIALTLQVFMSTLNRMNGREVLFSSNQIFINGFVLLAILLAAEFGFPSTAIAVTALISTTIGCFSMAVVQFLFLDPTRRKLLLCLILRGAKPSLHFRRWVVASHTLLRASPLIVGLLLQQTLVFISLSFASFADEGSLAIVGIGERLTNVLMMLYAGTMLTVLEPRWGRLFATNDHSSHLRIASDIKLISLGLVPLTSILVGCGPDIATLLFDHGKFEGKGALMLATVTSAFGWALPGLVLSLVLGRVLVIASAARVITVGGVVLVSLHWSACSLLVDRWGVVAIPTALAVACATQAVLFGAVAANRVPALGGLIKSFVPRIFVVACATGAFVYVTRGGWSNSIIDILWTASGALLLTVVTAVIVGLRPQDDLKSLASR